MISLAPVEEATPPHFEELAELWSSMVLTEARRGFVQAINKMGDPRTQKAMATWLEITPELDLDQFIAGLARREKIIREWREFFSRYDAWISPSSWMDPFPFDYDQEGPEVFRKIIRAQSPQLAVAMASVPGLSVPTGVSDNIPAGVQVVADRFREDICLHVGQALEDKVGVFTPIDPRG